MSTLLNGSICLTDIPKELITTSQKNGKKYLNINVWINDEPDQYNNNGSISISQSKEQREQGLKKVYIGNVKYAQQPQQQQAAPTAIPQVQQPVGDLDDLPF